MVEILLLMAIVEFSSIETIVEPDFVVVFDQLVNKGNQTENSSKIPEVRGNLDTPAIYADVKPAARLGPCLAILHS